MRRRGSQLTWITSSSRRRASRSSATSLPAPLSAADARENLVRHLTSPVRFDASVAALTAAGADMFVEVGFGGVLANLVKRIDKTATRACVQDRASFDGCLAVASATDSE